METVIRSESKAVAGYICRQSGGEAEAGKNPNGGELVNKDAKNLAADLKSTQALMRRQQSEAERLKKTAVALVLDSICAELQIAIDTLGLK